MKKLAIILLFFTFFNGGSDPKFSIVFKSKFSFNPDKLYLSGDGKVAIGRDDSQMEMLDGTSGKSGWKISYKEIKIKSPRHVYNSEAGLILLFNKDSKKENGEKIIIDFNTGKELWRTKGYPGIDNDDKFHFAHCFGFPHNGVMIVFDKEASKFTGLDIRTGTKKWESKPYADVDLKDNISIREIEGSEYVQVLFAFEKDEAKDYSEFMSILTGEKVGAENFVFGPKSSNYKKEGSNYISIAKKVGNIQIKLFGSMKRFSPFNITYDLRVSGDVKWSKTFKSQAHRKLFNSAPYVKLDVQDDKIFVIGRNLNVFDLKTGNQLWEVPFDNCDHGMAGLKAKQVLGIAGWPLAAGDAVYFTDLVGRSAIKKVNAQTGKEIWQTEPIKQSDRVLNLNIINGVLIAQFGGLIERELQWQSTGADGSKYDNKKRESYFDGDYGVRAYDVNTGATLWNTNKLADKLNDKFSDRITTVYGVGKNLVVASDKNLFCLDAKTGDVVYQTNISKSEIGDAFDLVVSDDSKSLYILCDEGIASADLMTGKLNYATKTGDIYWAHPDEESSYSFTMGTNYFVLLGSRKDENSSEFIGFDLATGQIKGRMKWKIRPKFTNDGNYIFDKDDEELLKYAVNKP